jgi:DNA-3-methyladenine glycosylase I
MTNDNIERCLWPEDDKLMLAYHDEEWGVPTRDDLTLFEFLALEAAQAGLSWHTVLHKRAAFNNAFEGFIPEQVAAYGPSDVERILQDPGVIRNRLKLQSIITNAQHYLEVQQEFSSFADYLWGFFGGDILPRPAKLTDDMIPTTTKESDALSVDLKKRGFKFAGSTICYAYMQSAGIVNDHITGCFRAP